MCVWERESRSADVRQWDACLGFDYRLQCFLNGRPHLSPGPVEAAVLTAPEAHRPEQSKHNQC